MTTTQRINERIVAGPAGCFLDPPGYPTHDFHIETDIRRRPENRGMMGLSYAVKDDYADWLHPTVKGTAQALLDRWHDNPPAIEDPDVQTWILRVLGYFRNCYAPISGSRNVADMVTDRARDPLEHQDRHLGVLLIRDFYPSFVATQQHFDDARWGS